MIDFDFQRIMSRQRRAGLRCFAKELREFTDTGLERLCVDLAAGYTPPIGSWIGCALSYRDGGPASARRDSHGESGNAFTVAWDRELIGRRDLERLVAAELRRRRCRRSSPTRTRPATRREGAAGGVSVRPSRPWTRRG